MAGIRVGGEPLRISGMAVILSLAGKVMLVPLTNRIALGMTPVSWPKKKTEKRLTETCNAVTSAAGHIFVSHISVILGGTTAGYCEPRNSQHFPPPGFRNDDLTFFDVSSINGNMTGTLSRKEREYREREAQILRATSELLKRDGYLKLNMDRIGQAIEYAKGTIYRHFDNKEDVIVALGVEMFTHEVAIFAKAASLQAISRERFMACGVALELHQLRYPEHLQIGQICGTPALFEKARPERQQELRRLEDQCMRTIAGICQDAIVAGDLMLEPGVTAEMVVFGPWATFTGAQVLMQANIPIVEKGIANPNAALWLNVQKMIDGYGWKPLSTQHDYEAVRQRVLAELFADEVAELEARRQA